MKEQSAEPVVGPVERAEEIPISPAFQLQPARVMIAFAVFAFFGAVIWVFAASPNIKWNVVGQYLFAPQILSGIRLTLILTVISMVAGVILGTLAALGRLSSILGFRLLSNAYIGLFRGTPLMVQVIFMFNLSLFIPYLFFGPWEISTNVIMTSMTAAIIALSLNEGAYMAEYIRGGILGVSAGQREAALSQGMTNSQALRWIIIPQALPAIIPAIGNQTISMLKSTSIVSVVAAAELLTQVQVIYNQNFLIIELLIVACIWYLFMVTVASILQSMLEGWLAQRSDRARTAGTSKNFFGIRSKAKGVRQVGATK